jgi:heat shock protein HslJ
MEQEQRYLQALRQATRYTLDAGRLIIFYEDGQELIFAPREP